MKKLTIGMIIKNESPCLERCLNGIKPILEKVDSELVIVDTGSTDNSVEIAKRYTDRVYFYEWTNNFADARNESLKYAEGEWFMFADADEFLDDPTEIICFFNSGEYKKYDAASYIQRNFTKANSESLYTDAFILRAFKRKSGRKFFGHVHETVKTDDMHGLKMLSKSVFKHWGYCVEQDVEKYKAKLEKYEGLLEKEVQIDPNNTIRYTQLASVYHGHVNFEPENKNYYYQKSIDVIEKAIEIEKKNNEKNGMLIVCAYYKMIAKVLYGSNRYSEIIDVCKKYFKTKEDNKIGTIGSDLDMYLFCGVAFYENCEYESAIEFLNNYFNIFKEVNSGQHATLELVTIDNATVNKVYYYFAVLKIIRAYAQMKKIDKADKALSEFLTKEDANLNGYLFERIDAEFDVIDITMDESRISRAAERYCDKSEEVVNYFIKKTEELIRKSKNRECIYENLSKSSLPQNYCNLIKLRYADITETEIDWNCLEYFFSENGYIDPMYGDVLYYSIKYGVNFDNIATVFNPDKIGLYIEKMTIDDVLISNAMYARINEDLGECDVSACRIYIELCRKFMLNDKTNKNVQLDFFARYAQISFEYLSLILNMDNLDENSAYILPITLREMYLSGFAYVELSDGNYSPACNYLNAICEFNSDFKIIYNIVYGMNVKDTVCTLIKSGNGAPAKELINQYIALYGRDEEIEELEKLV